MAYKPRLRRDSALKLLRTAYEPAKDELVPVCGLETFMIDCFRAKVFEACGLNRTYAARTIGITRRSFVDWMHRMESMGYTWPKMRGGGHLDRPKPSERLLKSIRKYASKYQRSLSKRKIQDDAP